MYDSSIVSEIIDNKDHHIDNYYIMIDIDDGFVYVLDIDTNKVESVSMDNTDKRKTLYRVDNLFKIVNNKINSFVIVYRIIDTSKHVMDNNLIVIKDICSEEYKKAIRPYKFINKKRELWKLTMMNTHSICRYMVSSRMENHRILAILHVAV